MDKKTLISEDLRKGLTENNQLCSPKDIEEIVDKYNSDKELSHKEIFILGYELSLLKKDRLDELKVFGYSSDQLFISNLNDLVSNLLKNL